MRAPLRLLLLCALASVACGEDPPPTAPPVSRDRDVGRPSVMIDAGFAPDADERPDALAPDADSAPDASDASVGPDVTSPPDATPVEDAGAGSDATAADATTPDATAPDATAAGDATTPDTGVVVPDADGDGISDADEGNGMVDTDGDMLTDDVDPDSDNDGIPDSVEAGDTDPMTPPVDTDSDGTPDFRDTDSDDDGLTDMIEGVADPDNDRLGAYVDLDSDGDGLPDMTEGAMDPDGDGVPNFLDRDSDGDTIRDDHDGVGDSDGDGVPGYLDLDSDGDSLPDRDEAGDVNINTPPRDSDFDGTADFMDVDSDNDRISDRDEGLVDTDGDGFVDALDIDSDNDSILDDVESGDTSTATPPADTDMDGVPDFRDVDSDNDTIVDISEGTVDTDMDGTPDRLDTDSDGDSWTDAQEAGDSDPVTPPVDTDMDRIPDFRDLDSDADTLADAVELGCAMNSTERALQDSDNDTFLDPAEVAFMTDPCSATSTITDFFFLLPPNGPGANAPLRFTNTDLDRADFAISMDTTGSMQGEIDNLRMTLSSRIIPDVRNVISDSAFGVTSFDDYPITPFGFAAGGDLPFHLNSRITTAPTGAQSAVNQLVTHVGSDFPESGIEALYQIATGRGTTWGGGSVPPFNPNQNRIVGVADGTIGGVGFRDGALPVILHVTDSISHTRQDYQAVDPTIMAAQTSTVRAALSNIGARVVTISRGFRPYNDFLCQANAATFFGAIDSTGDADWFELSGAQAGDAVVIETFAQRSGSNLNTRVAVASGAAILTENADIAMGNIDSRTTATLSGPGPYYVVVAENGDTGYTGVAGSSNGHYLVNVTVNGTAVLPSPRQCRQQDSNQRQGATPLVTFAQSRPTANLAQCLADCERILGPLSPLFQDFTYPYEMAEDTNAVIPTCAWSEFGPGRPTGCAANQCCTGRNGAGVSTNFNGQCPLNFEIDDTGAGIDQAMVTGIEALVKFSTFTFTTRVRPDPAEMMATGIDTTCFIHGVIPTGATPPNSCSPTPRLVDRIPPSPELDTFENVVPGTDLTFRVDALNQRIGTMTPCAPSTNMPRLFRAYIDVVADGVTVVDTRDVIIIVPPTPPGGSN